MMTLASKSNSLARITAAWRYFEQSQRIDDIDDVIFCISHLAVYARRLGRLTGVPEDAWLRIDRLRVLAATVERRWCAADKRQWEITNGTLEHLLAWLYCTGEAPARAGLPMPDRRMVVLPAIPRWTMAKRLGRRQYHELTMAVRRLTGVTPERLSPLSMQRHLAVLCRMLVRAGVLRQDAGIVLASREASAAVSHVADGRVLLHEVLEACLEQYLARHPADREFVQDPYPYAEFAPYFTQAFDTLWSLIRESHTRPELRPLREVFGEALRVP